MRLIAFDVEGTLFKTKLLPGTTIPSTIWQGIAEHLGAEAVRKEVATHKRWEDGGYSSYLEWMEDTIRIHIEHGLTRESFDGLIGSTQYNEGVEETVATLDHARYRPILISGGFRELATRAQRDLRIPHAFAACEYLFGKDGSLDYYNLLPCDFNAKLDFVRLMLREVGLTEADWLFVGDGPNDIPIAKAAPISIGYRPHVDLAPIVTHVMNDFRELPALLDQIS